MSQQQNQPEKHNIRPVAKGSKPDDIGSRAADAFDGIGHEMWNRYIKPGILGLMSQMWHGAGDYIYRIISNGGNPPPAGSYGHASYGNTSYYKYGRNNNSYNNYNNGPSGPSGPDNMKRSDRVRKVDTWTEAQDVKEELTAALEQYGSLTISDFYAATPSDNPDDNKIDWQTGNNWGWYDISTIQFRTSYDGKVEIVMPRPVPLKR